MSTPLTTAQAANDVINSIASLASKDAGLQVDVTVVDHRISFGRNCFKVTPVAGGGSTWVDEYRLTFAPF